MPGLKKSSQFNISLPFAWCLLQAQYRAMTWRFSQRPNWDEEREETKVLQNNFFSHVCIFLHYKGYKISGIIRPQFCDRILAVFVRHLILHNVNYLPSASLQSHFSKQFPTSVSSPDNCYNYRSSTFIPAHIWSSSRFCVIADKIFLSRQCCPFDSGICIGRHLHPSANLSSCWSGVRQYPRHSTLPSYLSQSALNSSVINDWIFPLYLWMLR